jgi:proteasome lid subunit RPN8/RPN11
VKDRAALAMILAGERSGALYRGQVLLDATSGNTGISYAMLGAERGYRVTLCVPANVTAERKRLLHAYGAELVLYDPTVADQDERVSTEEAYELVRRLARQEGILVGPSSGAALAACLRVAEDVDRAVIVTIFPDRGDRYLSEGFWNGAERDVEPHSPQEVPDVVKGIAVPEDVLAAIRDHGADAYPDECCGVLIGDESGKVTEAFALSNTTAGERRRRFLIGPDDYRIAEARAREVDKALIGFYHSHPDHPAVPSAFDLEHAWPNMHYVIVSVQAGRPDGTRSWMLRADRSAFEEEPFVIGPASARAATTDRT